jgi:septal ring factor EnvC (AmiA/AmiB activator)
MNGENSKDLTDSEKLDLILAELADLRTRVVKLEFFAEDRSRDTRPMLDRIHKEIADTHIEVKEVKDRVIRMERKLDVLNSDVLELRAADREFEQRLTVIERQPV